MRKIFKKLAFFFVAILSLTVSSSYNVKEVRAEDGTWTLVTDVSTLAVGDQVVIAAKDANFAMSTTQNNNILLVISNFSNKEREINILDNYKDYNKKVLLNNYDNESNILKPYQSVLYLLTKE